MPKDVLISVRPNIHGHIALRSKAVFMGMCVGIFIYLFRLTSQQYVNKSDILKHTINTCSKLPSMLSSYKASKITIGLL